MNDGRRYVTLRDYLRVLRERRLLIVLVAAVAAGLAMASTITHEPVYTARAALSFQDQSQDLGVIGVPAASSPTPEKLAEANARTITGPDVVASVREALNIEASTGSVTRALSAQVEPSSNLVVLEARAKQASFAADLANEFARQGVRKTNRDARVRFASAATSLKRRARRARRAGQDPTTRLALSEQIARLESLSVLARPAAIQELAEASGSPTSPRLALRAALGLVGGLLLGALAAFVRDSLDRRLRDSNEVRAYVDLPLLAQIRADAMGHAPYSSNDHTALSAPDFEAFRILRTALEFLSPGSSVRSVVVTSALPEEGKTTVATGLAFAGAMAGKQTLLVECDLRRPALVGRLEVDASPGLTDLLHGDAALEKILQRIAVDNPGIDRSAGEDAQGKVTAESRLSCITAGSRTAHPAELVGSERFRTFLADVTQTYDLVVVDTSPLLPVVDTLELLPLVDAIVLCVRAQQTTRDQALAAKAALDQVPPRPTGVVVTGTLPRLEEGYSYYSYGDTGTAAEKMVRS